MPILKWFPSQGPPRAFVLHKPVTTVGRALGNDVALAGDGLAETHAQVLFDGRDFNLEEVDKQADILVNGKKKRRARLVHGDRLTLGDVSLSFSMFDEPARSSSGGQAPATLSDTSFSLSARRALRSIAFSRMRLACEAKIEEDVELVLVEQVLDAVRCPRRARLAPAPATRRARTFTLESWSASTLSLLLGCASLRASLTMTARPVSRTLHARCCR